MSIRDEPFLVRSGLLSLINRLPDRIRREDVRSFLEWEKDFVAARDDFYEHHLNGMEARNDIISAFSAVGMFFRALSNNALDAFRSGAEEFVMPENVLEFRQLARQNAQGRGSAALITQYLVSQKKEVPPADGAAG